MEKRKHIYSIINILVLAGSVLCFYFSYAGSVQTIRSLPAAYFFMLPFIVFSVHFIKAMRMYFILYGTGNLEFREHLKIYCKTAMVSMLLPYKMGDLFRMYCYTAYMDSGIKSIIVVLLDRFMDTLALITVILFTSTVVGLSYFGPLLLILLIFVFCIIAAYLLFPGLSSFWNLFLLKARATPNTIRTLRLIHRGKAVYQEVIGITKGRGVMLYILSLIAWMIEIGGVAFFCRSVSTDPVNTLLPNYLMAALGRSESTELNGFVIFSCAFLILVYAGIKLYEQLTVRRVKKERRDQRHHRGTRLFGSSG